MILFFTSLLSPLVPIVAGINTRSMVWLYVITCFLFDLIVILLRRGLHLPHHPVTNLFLLAEFIIVSFIFKKQLNIAGKVFWILVTLPAIYFVADTLNDNLFLRELNTAASSYFYIIFILFSVYGFYRILIRREVLMLEQSPDFWINVAFLIYASGCCLFFIFKDYLKVNYPATFASLWGVFFLSLNIAKNLILAIAISKQKPKVA